MTSSHCVPSSPCGHVMMMPLPCVRARTRSVVRWNRSCDNLSLICGRQDSFRREVEEIMTCDDLAVAGLVPS
jgi:hypothetical protein